MPSFAVITPTTGTDDLERCIMSLRGQDCVHYIVVDGREHNRKVNEILVNRTGLTQQEKMIWLDENIGKGWYGHRVYAASPFLVNEEVICYLDEDNWVEPNYIESFKKVLNTRQWAFTLRNIVDADGSFICQDNCENLGLWPVIGDRTGRHHVDTSCFAVPRNIAVKVSHAWYGQWGADRQFFDALRGVAPQFGCTGKYTLNYRLGGATNMATKEMFLQGNTVANQIYQGVFPWSTENAAAPATGPQQKNTLIYRTS